MSYKSDPRSTARPSHRAAAHKAKWAHGTKPAPPGRASTHPRPIRPSDLTHPARRASPPKSASRLPDDSDDSSDGWADQIADEAGADAHGRPATGSQVLPGALARAIVAWEDRETARLVGAEWSVLDIDGEEVGVGPVKKGKRGAEEEGLGGDFEIV